MEQLFLTKISNYGTSHPVTARLAVQTDELLKWSALDKEKRNRVFETYNGMKNRLYKCHEAFERMNASLKEALEYAGGMETLKGLPHVIGLQGEAETFLYETKNYLRDLAGVFAIFFDAPLFQATGFCSPGQDSDSPVSAWAAKKFGPEDPFTAMLRSERLWVEELIWKRNAVEHPGGHSGTLFIKNFQQQAGGKYMLPVWHRDQLPPTGIYPDIDVALDNLLTIAEDILVSCLVHTTPHKGMIEFAELSLEERNPECPIRIRVQAGPKMQPLLKK